MLSPNEITTIVEEFKELADYFMTIRMDYSDPRTECRAGMQVAKDAIKRLTGEDYTPKDLVES